MTAASRGTAQRGYVVNIRTLLVGSIAFCVVGLSGSCLAGSRSAVLGQWKEVSGTEVIEFFRDGTITILDQSGASMGGNYKWIEGNRMRIELSGLGALMGPMVATVTVSGSELRLAMQNGEVWKYRRM